MDLKEFLYLAAIVVFALGCRSFNSLLLQKLGLYALLAASYLAGYWLTDSHVAGVGGVLIWFLLPFVEIFGRARKLRFPIRRQVKGRFPPSREQFPELPDLTEELTQIGYQEVEDAGWRWQQTDHFVRLLYHPEKRIQATIAFSVQGYLTYTYASLTSRLKDGTTYTTSNFPFPPTLRFAPHQRVNRFPNPLTFEEFEEEHLQFLETSGVDPDQFESLDLERLSELLEEEMSRQIDHNLETGVIEPLGDGEFRYSWRGCFFLWVQVVKDTLSLV